MDWLQLEQVAVPRFRSIPQKHPRRGTEDHAEPASRLWRAALGRRISRDGTANGHRSGEQEICSFRHHRQKIRDKLDGSAAPPAGEAWHRLLVARLAAGAEHQNAGRESDVVAELRALLRSGT